MNFLLGRFALLPVACLALALTGCPLDQAPAPNPLSSFKVKVLGVFERVGGARNSLAVVAPCVALYGSQAAVPFDVKGQPGCRYVIPRGEVEFEITARSAARASKAPADAPPHRDGW